MLGWFNIMDARRSLESTQEGKELHPQGLAASNFNCLSGL